MAYTPTDWADGVTPVDEAHMDHVEAGIVTADANATQALADAAAAQADADAAAAALPAKENKSEKGAVSGYAPLDASQKVPLANLPPVGSDLVYNGDWSSATSYEDGDIVMYNGVLYICVVPTVTAPPENWGVGGAVGTSLPGSPYDGQEFTLVDSLTAPTYSWRFKYVASITDANKWIFIGGAPAVISNTADEGLSLAANTWYAFNAMSFTAPRAGIYDVQGQCRVYSPSSVRRELGLGYNGSNPGGQVWPDPVAAGDTTFTSVIDREAGITAGGLIKLFYRWNNAVAAANGAAKEMKIWPVRVA